MQNSKSGRAGISLFHSCLLIIHETNLLYSLIRFSITDLEIYIPVLLSLIISGILSMTLFGLWMPFPRLDTFLFITSLSELAIFLSWLPLHLGNERREYFVSVNGTPDSFQMFMDSLICIPPQLLVLSSVLFRWNFFETMVDWLMDDALLDNLCIFIDQLNKKCVSFYYILEV